MMIYRLILMFACVATGSHASQVIQVSEKAMAVSHPSDRAFAVNDAVCAVQGDKKVACGRVAKVSPKGAIVRLSLVKGSAQKGDSVIRLGSRKAASTSTEAVSKPLRKVKNTLGVGFMGGTAYQYTIVFYERALGEKFSLRIEPTYFLAALSVDTSGSVASYSSTTLGAKLGFSFHSMAPFQGFWINAGVGFYSFSIMTLTPGAESIPNFGTVVASAMLGFRAKLGKLFSFGLSAGGQYLPFSSSFGVAAFQPVGNANLSILF